MSRSVWVILAFPGTKQTTIPTPKHLRKSHIHTAGWLYLQMSGYLHLYRERERERNVYKATIPEVNTALVS